MIKLYIPKLEDYWYEQKIQSDAKTMSYNAGYDVSYFGYHYDTGCIDFPKSRWQEVFDRRKKENRFFAYLHNGSEFVGYVNYQWTGSRYECGIVIESIHRGKGYAKEGLILLCEHAKKEGISALYDAFEVDRGNTLALFLSVGFQVVEKPLCLKFNHQVQGVIVKKDLVNED